MTAFNSERAQRALRWLIATAPEPKPAPDPDRNPIEWELWMLSPGLELQRQQEHEAQALEHWFNDQAHKSMYRRLIKELAFGYTSVDDLLANMPRDQLLKLAQVVREYKKLTE